MPEGTVALGYNSGPGETLLDEARRLFPKVAEAELGQHWKVTAPCYNIGVLAARRSTLQAIYERYLRDWEAVSAYLGHAARQQWLVCHTIAELGLCVQAPGYGWHANGHYGVPPGVSYANGLVMYEGAPVLFRHKL